jgi:hypothetical protein
VTFPVSRRGLLVAAGTTAAALAVGTSSTPAATATHLPTYPDNHTDGSVVISWNQSLLSIVRTAGAQPATVHPTRSFAILHAAIHNAVVATTRAGTPYLFAVHADTGASPVAPAAQAAHSDLVDAARVFARLNLALADAVIAFLRRQVPLPHLAAHHRDPARRQRHQPGHSSRPCLEQPGHHTTTSPRSRPSPTKPASAASTPESTRLDQLRRPPTRSRPRPISHRSNATPMTTVHTSARSLRHLFRSNDIGRRPYKTLTVVCRSEIERRLHGSMAAC